MKKSKIVYMVMGIYVLIAVIGIAAMHQKKKYAEPADAGVFMPNAMNGTASKSPDILDTSSGTESGGQTEASDKQEDMANGQTGASDKQEDMTNGQTEASDKQEDMANGQPETSAETVYVYTVKGAETVNLRATPDTSRKPITYLREGTTGRVIEQGEYFTLIEYGNIQGYMSNKYLEIRQDE